MPAGIESYYSVPPGLWIREPFLLVKDEEDRAARGGAVGNSAAPVGLDPGRIQGNRAVGGSIDGGNADGFLNLSGNGGLPHLPGADQDMNDRRLPGKFRANG